MGKEDKATSPAIPKTSCSKSEDYAKNLTLERNQNRHVQEGLVSSAASTSNNPVDEVQVELYDASCLDEWENVLPENRSLAFQNTTDLHVYQSLDGIDMPGEANAPQSAENSQNVCISRSESLSSIRLDKEIAYQADSTIHISINNSRETQNPTESFRAANDLNNDDDDYQNDICNTTQSPSSGHSDIPDTSSNSSSPSTLSRSSSVISVNSSNSVSGSPYPNISPDLGAGNPSPQHEYIGCENHHQPNRYYSRAPSLSVMSLLFQANMDGQSNNSGQSTGNPHRCTCRYRSHTARPSPPCYICSTKDLPPKYREKECDNLSWRKVKSKFLSALQNSTRKNSSQQTGTQGLTTPAFLVSDGILPDSANVSSPRSHESTEPLTLPSSPDSLSGNSRTAGQDNSEQTQTTHYSQGTQENRTNTLRSNIPGHSQFDHGSVNSVETSNINTILRMATSDPPPYPMSEGVPPPYSPATTQISLSPGFPQQNYATEVNQSLQFDINQMNLTKICRCNLLYSTLLGALTTVAIFGTKQPLPLLACSITFFTFLIFMPVIWALEFLFQIRAHRSHQ